ncbi:MAG: M28 family peptidase [bacterium]
MIKLLGIILFSGSIVGSCANKSHNERMDDIKSDIELIPTQEYQKYANSISIEDLKEHVFELSSPIYEGRRVGSKGQKRAANYLVNYYKELEINAALDSTYFQAIPGTYFKGKFKDSENVIAYIRGSEFPEEYVVITGHFDHEGISEEGKVFVGADDNNSGTSAVLEIAEAFKLASEDGKQPKRSIVLMHFTAEEIGLYGSKYYTENPIFPLEQTIACLNLDMVGRIDRRYSEKGESNYIYLIGSNRLSHELHYLSIDVNNNFTKLNLDFTFNEPDDRNRYYYRSDHYNFAKNNIPSIFYFNGVHDDYSKETDTPDKIDLPLLQKRTQFVFATAWQLANQKNRLTLD